MFCYLAILPCSPAVIWLCEFRKITFFWVCLFGGTNTQLKEGKICETCTKQSALEYYMGFALCWAPCSSPMDCRSGFFILCLAFPFCLAWVGTFLWIQFPHLQEKRSWTKQSFKSLSGFNLLGFCNLPQPPGPCIILTTFSLALVSSQRRKADQPDILSWRRRQTLVKKTAPGPGDQGAAVDYPHLTPQGYPALRGPSRLGAGVPSGLIIWFAFSPKRPFLNFSWKHSLCLHFTSSWQKATFLQTVPPSVHL